MDFTKPLRATRKKPTFNSNFRSLNVQKALSLQTGKFLSGNLLQHFTKKLQLAERQTEHMKGFGVSSTENGPSTCSRINTSNFIIAIFGCELDKGKPFGRACQGITLNF